jgi:hypothetical protein
MEIGLLFQQATLNEAKNFQVLSLAGRIDR